MTTAETNSVDRPVPFGGQILLRYRYPDGRLQAALPMRVVEDRPDRLVAWLAPETEIMYWALADGRDPRVVPLGERFRMPLRTAPRRWQGPGVLRVIPLQSTYQVLHFWGDDGTFSGWYVNLEAPKTRRGTRLEHVRRRSWRAWLYMGGGHGPGGVGGGGYSGGGGGGDGGGGGAPRLRSGVADGPDRTPGDMHGEPALDDGDDDQDHVQLRPIASSTSDATGQDAKHASVPLRRVRAGEALGDFSLPLQGRPAGGRLRRPSSAALRPETRALLYAGWPRVAE